MLVSLLAGDHEESQEDGLITAYKRNADLKLLVKKMMAMPLLPADRILTAFEILRADMPDLNYCSRPP